MYLTNPIASKSVAIVPCGPLFCDPHKAFVGLARFTAYPSISTNCDPLLSTQQVFDSTSQYLRPAIRQQRQEWSMIVIWWLIVSSDIMSF